MTVRIGSDKISQPRPKSEEKRRNRHRISINAAKIKLRNVDAPRVSESHLIPHHMVIRNFLDV